MKVLRPLTERDFEDIVKKMQELPKEPKPVIEFMTPKAYAYFKSLIAPFVENIKDKP